MIAACISKSSKYYFSLSKTILYYLQLFLLFFLFLTFLSVELVVKVKKVQKSNIKKK